MLSKHWPWLLFLSLIALLTVLIALADVESRREKSAAAKEEAVVAAVKQRQAEAQRVFDATSEGMKLKAQQEQEAARADKEARKKSLQEKNEQFARLLYAKSCTNLFLDQGFDVECMVSGQQLILEGPAVNRVFAHQFFIQGTVKSLKRLGFMTVKFSNLKADFSETFALADS